MTLFTSAPTKALRSTHPKKHSQIANPYNLNNEYSFLNQNFDTFY